MVHLSFSPAPHSSLRAKGFGDDIRTQGRPVPSVEWLDNNGQVISDSERFKIENVGLSTVLTIRRLRVEDRGEFKLRIRNRCGQDTFPIGIQITDRPGPPGRPSVQDQNVDSVRLLWSAPTQDGGSPIRYYTVEKCTVSEKVWTKAETTKQPFVTLFNLSPDEAYLFRVRADNVLGQSEPSEESDIVYVKDVSRAVEEPKKRSAEQEENEAINYDRLDAKVDLTKHKPIDINRLPNDLQAKYIICEELGQGAYGTVYRAIEKATGKTWAAKMVQVRPGVKREDVLHEITIMDQLNHEKLLHLHEAFDLGNEMCLIEEFVSGGELFDKIMEDDSLMSEQEVRDYMHQILLGVQHMHKNQIVHLDLKPENILLKSKNSTDVKIIDFGLARKLDPKKSVKLLFGTPEFCAPEVVNYQPVGLGTDMWTIGVISYVLLSGLSPFLGDSDEETLANVSAADWDFDDPSWDDVSDTAKDFICRLMMKDKRRRMTVQEALRHPWITGPLLSAFNDLSEYIKKTQPAEGSGPLPTRQKKNFMSLQRWSDDLLPIGRLANRGAIFRRLTMDGVFERNITFETEYPPSVKKQLEDIVANVGDLIATLSCNLEGNPEPQIAWFKDNKELVVSSSKYQARYSDGLSELTIKNIEESDAGRYSCRATNELGSITTKANLTVGKRKAETSPAELSRRKSTKITVEEVVINDSPPAFHHQLTDCSEKLGEQKILCVTNTTLPEPSVEWYHNGVRIHESDPDYLQKHDKGRYELTILSVCLNDQGEWRAVGKNAYGQCESSCSLTVEVPDGHLAPTFDRPLEDVRCGEGSLLRFNVKLTANPPPKISWYHNGEEIRHTDRYRPQYDDEKRDYSLTIMNAQPKDSGQYKVTTANCDVRCDDGVCTLTVFTATVEGAGCYTCVAENIHGSSESSTIVHIIPPLRKDHFAPKFVELLTNRSVLEHEEIHLEWKDFTHSQVQVIGMSLGRVTPSTSRCPSPSAQPSPSKPLELRTPVITRPLEDAVVTVGNRELLELEVDSVAPPGDPACFSCRVRGDPAPVLCWLHNGRAIHNGPSYRRQSLGEGEACLDIPSVSHQLCGTYTAVASNPFGDAHSSAVLKLDQSAQQNTIVIVYSLAFKTTKIYDIFDDRTSISSLTETITHVQRDRSIISFSGYSKCLLTKMYIVCADNVHNFSAFKA
ncbi:immunoglobulin I-set domain protein [Teladorsagia circumcincta]|uniref:Immunoglobulin I-set domain protein n=1 Tax=Teladorsagia circumcincta TaxID=45464 RepID=A0A2G9V0M6_TELCI|nr:immunoglobulin I-set domain protein [Teladorsagia circumcincta]